jgi:phage tail sheath protein FI
VTEPTFGLTFARDSNEPRPVVPSDLSVIGLVLPSEDADSVTFPLNVPVEFNSSDTAYLSKMGTGDLYRAVTAINDQLGDLQVAARVVAVRVAKGANDNETIANIIGSQANGTGLYALLKAGQLLALIPRIIGAPGYTGRFARASAGSTDVTSAVKTGGNIGDGTVTLGAPEFLAGVQAGVYKVRCRGGTLGTTSAPKSGGNTGDGTITAVSADPGAAKGIWKIRCVETTVNGGRFAIEDPSGSLILGLATVGNPFDGAINFTLNDGTADFALGDGFDVTVFDAVPANGGVFTVQRPDGSFGPEATVGVEYASQVKFTISDGTTDFIIGDGFDLTVTGVAGTALANPICAELPAICAQLMAHAVVGGPGTTKQDAIDWRETINSDRLVCVDNWSKLQEGTQTVDEDGAARVMGIGVRVDHQHRGVPSHSWANQVVNGIVGLKRYDAFSLVDGATDAQILLSHNIGITARGELGVETAIASSGFVFVGTDNAGDDPLWQFYNVTRMRDYIHLALLKSLRKRLGTTNITPHGIQAVLNDVTLFLRDLKADEHILGGKVGFEKDKNSPENLRLGKFRLFFNAEEPPVLRRIDIDSRRHRPALEALLETLIAQANTLIA